MILEDNDERIRAFESAVASLGSEFRLRLWRDAPTMIAECSDCIKDACLISLDHDLAALPGSSADPGTGLEVAEFLSRQEPSCPVILHTSNYERRWSIALQDGLLRSSHRWEMIGFLAPGCGEPER